MVMTESFGSILTNWLILSIYFTYSINLGQNGINKIEPALQTLYFNNLSRHQAYILSCDSVNDTTVSRNTITVYTNGGSILEAVPLFIARLSGLCP